MRRRQAQGFTYLIALFVVALMGAGLAVVGQVWHTSNLRERELQLLFVGNEIRSAIASYYLRSPGGQHRYPRSFDDLIKDQRFPQTVRHLRKLYPDPITNSSEWGLIPAPGGGIMGVYSRSADRPIKMAKFGFAHRVFEERALVLKDKMTYRDWQFVYPPGALVDSRSLPEGPGVRIR